MFVNKQSYTSKVFVKPNLYNLSWISVLLSLFTVLILAIYKPTILSKVSNKMMEVVFQDVGYGRDGKDVNLNTIQSAIIDKLGVSNNEKLKTLRFDIKYKHWSKITNKRNNALEEGFLVSNSDDYIPVQINFEGKKIKAKVRLKGDMVDHLQGDKWSFRVKIKGNDHIFGLKKFNIQHPQTRGYQGQLIIDDIYSRYGLITPKHLFVNVEVNGQKLGIMLMEEHFSKELLERHKRKEGVIVKFNESIFWKSLLLNDGDTRLHKPSINPFWHYTNTNIDVFSKTKVDKSEFFRGQYSLAVSMLRGFVEGHVKPSEIFDVNMMGSYLAIANFFKVGHDTLFNNQRFYLNPLTLKIEPIPYDANLGYDIRVVGEPIVDKILEDLEVKKVFDNVMGELNGNFNSDKYILNLKTKEDFYLRQLKSEFYFLEGFDYSLLGDCSGLTNTNFPVYIHAYVTNNNNNNFLELKNATCEDIEVVSIERENPTEGEIKNNKFMVPFRLEKVRVGELAKTASIRVRKPDGKYKIIARRLSNGKLQTHYSMNYPNTIKKNPFPNNDINSLLNQHVFFKLNGSVLNVKKGVINVNGSVVTPCGYKVVINKGTILQFDKDGSWYSCGEMKIKGSKKEAVIFQPKKGVESWQGIAVYNAKTESIWSNVIIEKTTGVNFPYLSLTGGVTFYKSDVHIEDSVFNKSFGEDALNIVHSKFTLNNVKIENTYSDAFDGDFVDGKITGGMHSNIGYGGGGDAIDVSGSKISVTGTVINNVDDKGFSLGENSRAQLNNVTVSNSGIAIASKDGSIVNVINSDINDSNKIFYASYMKKPVYGNATLDVKNNKTNRLLSKYKVQKGNILIINGQKITGTDIDVKSMYKK
jgi:hypothetical protein